MLHCLPNRITKTKQFRAINPASGDIKTELFTLIVQGHCTCTPTAHTHNLNAKKSTSSSTTFTPFSIGLNLRPELLFQRHVFFFFAWRVTFTVSSLHCNCDNNKNSQTAKPPTMMFRKRKHDVPNRVHMSQWNTMKASQETDTHKYTATAKCIQTQTHTHRLPNKETFGTRMDDVSCVWIVMIAQHHHHTIELQNQANTTTTHTYHIVLKCNEQSHYQCMGCVCFCVWRIITNIV